MTILTWIVSAQNHFHSKRLHTITQMNDNINMDSVITCIFMIVDWKAHGSEYYECSRYKENPNIANESAHAQAREALKKYLFYFERVITMIIYTVKPASETISIKQ